MTVANWLWTDEEHRGNIRLRPGLRADSVSAWAAAPETTES